MMLSNNRIYSSKYVIPVTLFTIFVVKFLIFASIANFNEYDASPSATAWKYFSTSIFIRDTIAAMACLNGIITGKNLLVSISNVIVSEFPPIIYLLEDGCGGSALFAYKIRFSRRKRFRRVNVYFCCLLCILVFLMFVLSSLYHIW